MAGMQGNYSLEMVEQMKQVLSGLKKKQPKKQEKITKTKALEMMSKELIEAMEKKNYSAEDIALVLKEKGMEVSALTVNRARLEGRKKGKRNTSVRMLEQK